MLANCLAGQVSKVQDGCDADKGDEKQGVENYGLHLISPIMCCVDPDVRLSIC